MANKINDTTTYPNTAPALTDHFIGTDVSDITNDASGETVTFTFQATMDLFEANMAAPTSIITSGTFANARISESSVTQHQAALTITESQISDLGTYQPFDAFLTDIANLTDPGADRILFWDDSAGDIVWLTLGSGLTISGTTASIDSTVATLTGTQTFTNKTLGAFTVSGAVSASADGTIDIGSNGTRFNNVYADILRADEGLVFTEAADHPLIPAAGLAQLWVSNDPTQKLYFTDDAGTDNEVLTSGAGSVLTDTAIATTDAWVFFDASDSDNPKQRLISSAISDLSLAVLGANTFTGTQDFNAQQVEGFKNKIVTGVTGALTVADHSGNVLETSGNVTVPTTAGFNCVLIAGGAHTVTFNATTSAAMAAGDLMTIVVEDGTTIHAVLTAAADKVSFT